VSKNTSGNHAKHFCYTVYPIYYSVYRTYSDTTCFNLAQEIQF